MKKIIITLIAVVGLATLAAFTMNGTNNSGIGFYYQAIARSADGTLLADGNLTLRVSLYPGLTASQPTWSEIHNVHTDNFGSFAITVGHGLRDVSCVASSYTDVDFKSVHYALKIEILEGGAFRTINFEMLPCVPYAEVALNAVSLPVGMIIPFAGPAENIPEGFILCDGREISRNTYADLYNAVGVAWGSGNGSTTFNIPDLRGMFLRGVAGTDTIGDPDANARLANAHGGNSGNNVGSYQGDAIRNITGNAHNNIQGMAGWGAQYDGALQWIDFKGDASWEDNVGGFSGLSFDASRVVPVGSDNRPKNVAVTYIIKY